MSTAIKLCIGNKQAKARTKLPDPEPKSTISNGLFNSLYNSGMITFNNR